MTMPINVNSKILLSGAAIMAAAALIIGATFAFFSDTETSTDNLLQAGAIDLGVDNESFYNGAVNTGTSWEISYDLDACTTEGEQGVVPCLFYNFDDIKPGDFGEDTISLHVKNNDCWLCSETTITADDDVDCNEPELDDETAIGCNDPDSDDFDGELGDNIEIMWWADDGDNVLEANETPIDIGFIGQGPQDTPVVRTIADSSNNIFSSQADDPIEGCDDPAGCTVYIAKAWCFGNMTPVPDDQDGFGNVKSPAGDNTGDAIEGSPEDGGFSCDGSTVSGNAAQTDKIMMDISFSAVQSRNNEDFVCLQTI